MDQVEKSVIAAHASVMIYDDVNKRWLPSGSTHGISKVQIFQHTLNKTFRVVGWKIQEKDVVINCAIGKSLKYNQATSTFHQWRDNKQVYGLNFASKDDADNFARVMLNVLDFINIAWRQRQLEQHQQQLQQQLQVQQGSQEQSRPDSPEHLYSQPDLSHRRQLSSGPPIIPELNSEYAQPFQVPPGGGGGGQYRTPSLNGGALHELDNGNTPASPSNNWIYGGGGGRQPGQTPPMQGTPPQQQYYSPQCAGLMRQNTLPEGLETPNQPSPVPTTIPPPPPPISTGGNVVAMQSPLPPAPTSAGGVAMQSSPPHPPPIPTAAPPHPPIPPPPPPPPASAPGVSAVIRPPGPPPPPPLPPATPSSSARSRGDEDDDWDDTPTAPCSLAAQLKQAKLKKVQSFTAGCSATAESAVKPGSGTLSKSMANDMMSEMQKVFAARKKAKQPDNSESGASGVESMIEGASTAPDSLVGSMSSTGGVGTLGRKQRSFSVANGDMTPVGTRNRRLVSLCGGPEPPPSTLSEAAASSGCTNSSASMTGPAAGGMSNQELEALKREILTDVRQEIQKAKSDIITAIRLELGKR